MQPPVRWAILGPGKIAHKFAAAFGQVPQASLHAVASRDIGRAKAFADEHRIAKVYSRYEDLAADPSVDAVYVATPHPLHYAPTILCLNHKKAVLCEKPLTMNYSHALTMVNAARANSTFLMEGMWSRFFPSLYHALNLIQDGSIGDVRFLRADFGFNSPFNPEGRVFNLNLGGGAQLDVGVYPMFLALLIFGKPHQIQAAARKAVTGADETTSVQFDFGDGRMAHILSSVGIDTPKRAEIMGTDGMITLHAPWHKSQKVTLKKNSGDVIDYDFPFQGIGFEFELRAVTDCILRGEKECEAMSLDFSLLMAATADEVLRQCGVVYPG